MFQLWAFHGAKLLARAVASEDKTRAGESISGSLQWLLAGGFISLPCGPLHGSAQDMTFPKQVTWERACMRESTQDDNLTLEVLCRHFCHFLLVTETEHGTMQEGKPQGETCGRWGSLGTTGTQHTGERRNQENFLKPKLRCILTPSCSFRRIQD